MLSVIIVARTIRSRRTVTPVAPMLGAAHSPGRQQRFALRATTTRLPWLIAGGLHGRTGDF